MRTLVPQRNLLVSGGNTQAVIGATGDNAHASGQVSSSGRKAPKFAKSIWGNLGNFGAQMGP
jgi:hypothetical protein